MKVDPVEIIVDLYYLRNTHLGPLADKIHTYDRVFYDFRYHSLSSAISLLTDRYKVRQIDIEDEIKKRSRDEDFSEVI